MESDTEKRVKELLDAVGALAEFLSVYRNTLMKGGFTRREAVEMCKDYARTVMVAGKGKSNG